MSTLTTKQYLNAYNEAIEAFSLSEKPVTKFATLADAQKRVEKLSIKYGLVLFTKDGRTLLVKKDAMTQDNFETSAEELAKQTNRPSNQPEETVDPTTAGDSVPTTAGDKLAEHTEANKAKAERKPRTPKVSREPRKASEIHPCREGTNQALLVDMLHEGASLAAMTSQINAAQGKSLSESVIYSTILYDVCTVKGYGVTSSLGDDGKPFFKLVLPKGMDKPLAHTERKTKAKSE